MIQYLETALQRHLLLEARRGAVGAAEEGRLAEWLAALERGCSFDCVVKLLFDHAPGEGRITVAPPTDAERRLRLLAPSQPARRGGQGGGAAGGGEAERVEVMADIAIRVEAKVKTLE